MNQEQFETAKAIADFACWLDGEFKNRFSPELKLEVVEHVERLHDSAMKLAGDRVDEIYCLEDEVVA